ncbi:polysaccharide pyruvyl transferase CsaB [bacterium]|nr:polysaccharide pyruvyl transferase CsaB [bacterium]
MTKKICISGYYGFDNFGDETILNVLVQNLKQFKQVSDITVFSSNPQKTATGLDVKSIKSFDIKSVIKEIAASDCLISGGGSLLQDKTSAKSLIYYLLLIVIAQLFKKKTIIFAQGIGPINNKFLNYLTINVLKRASYITVRDNNSLNLLKRNGINAQICSDPVWNINIPNTEKKDKIGIQLRNFSTVTENFLEELAICINKFYSDKEICLLSLQNSQDIEVLNKFKNYLLNINPNINITLIENTANEKVINDIAQMNTIIAMRYHACLIAIKAGVKLLPINYDIKVETLSKDFGLNYINMDSETEHTFCNFISSDTKYNQEKINNLYFNFKELEEKL